MAAAGNFMGALMGQLQPTIDRREADKQAQKQNMRDILLKGMQTDPAQNEGESDTDYNARKQAYHQQILDEYNKTLSHPHAKELLQKAGQALGLYHKMGAPQGGGPLPAPTASAPVDNGMGPGIDLGQGPVNRLAAPPTPGLNVNAGGFETGAGAPKGPTGSASPLGAAPNTPTPSPAAALPPPAIPKPVAPAPFNYAAQQSINNQAPVVADKRLFDIYLQRGKEIGLNGPDLAEYAASHGQKLPTGADRMVEINPQWAKENLPMLQPDATGRIRLPLSTAAGFLTGGPKTPIRLKLTDGTEISGMRDKSGHYSTLGGAAIDPATIDQEVKTSNASPRINASEVLTLDHAKQLEQSGAELKGEDGKTIELADIPAGMVLQAVHRGDKTFYTPRELKQSHITVGGKVYQFAFDPSQAQELGNAQGNVTRTHEVAGQDANGNPIAIPLQSSVTQKPTGMNRQTPPATAAPAPTVPKSAVPTAPLATTGASTGARALPGMTNSQMTQAVPRVIALKEASTGIDRLAPFADLANDPSSRQKLGKAFNLVLNEWDNVTHSGDFTQLIKNEAGVRSAVAESQAKVYDDAVRDLNPREREYFNDMMSALSTTIALRSLTKAPATQFSVNAIERELPLIGRGASVTDDKSYNQKLDMLRTVVKNGSFGIPSQVMKSSGINQTPSPSGNLAAPTDWKSKAKAAKVGDTIDTPRGKAKKLGENQFQLVTQ